MPSGGVELAPGVVGEVVYCSPEAVVVETRLARGAAVPMHRHGDAVQVTVVLEGRLRLTVGGVERVLGPGDYVVVPPGVLHGGEALEDTRVLDINAPLTPERRRLAERAGVECRRG